MSLSQDYETLDEDIMQPEESFDTNDEYDNVYHIIPDNF